MAVGWVGGRVLVSPRPENPRSNRAPNTCPEGSVSRCLPHSFTLLDSRFVTVVIYILFCLTILYTILTDSTRFYCAPPVATCCMCAWVREGVRPHRQALHGLKRATTAALLQRQLYCCTSQLDVGVAWSSGAAVAGQVAVSAQDARTHVGQRGPHCPRRWRLGATAHKMANTGGPGCAACCC